MSEIPSTRPSLTGLAEAAGLSPGYFHRLFKAITGLAPTAYAMAYRAERLRRSLIEAQTVTAAIYDAGFGSDSRFYEASTALLGMTPSAYRAGGASERLRFAVGQCSLGAILVASSDKGVAAILLGDDPDELLRDLQDRFRCAELIGGDETYEGSIVRVVGFVEAPGMGLAVRLHEIGSVAICVHGLVGCPLRGLFGDERAATVGSRSRIAGGWNGASAR